MQIKLIVVVVVVVVQVKELITKELAPINLQTKDFNNNNNKKKNRTGQISELPL